MGEHLVAAGDTKRLFANVTKLSGDTVKNTQWSLIRNVDAGLLKANSTHNND